MFGKNKQNLYEILGFIEENIEDYFSLTSKEIEEAALEKIHFINKKISELEEDPIPEYSDQKKLKVLRKMKNSVETARRILTDPEERKNYNESLLNNGKGYKVKDVEEDKKGLSTKAKKIITGSSLVAVIVAVAAASGCVAYKAGKGANNNKNATVIESQETTIPKVPETTKEIGEHPIEEPTNKDVIEEETITQEIGNNDYNNYDLNYGDIEDTSLVEQRAEELVGQLNASNIVNPSTARPYTTEEITKLIQYANGMYTPKSMKQIDKLHLDLLNLLISPINTEGYLYHVAYAAPTEYDINQKYNKEYEEEQRKIIADMRKKAEKAEKINVDFGKAFSQYNENGVYPLTRWMQEKRNEIYSTTEIMKIRKIFREVGQVMADIMKGNGATITVYEGKSEVTYKFTSEQILANHASAMLLTTDAQMIFANNTEGENVKNWTVNNKLILNADSVSLDEIQAWINNGCDYKWEIDDVLIDGQTFGQRIQGDMEGMAQNNYAMEYGYSKKLTK